MKKLVLFVMTCWITCLTIPRSFSQELKVANFQNGYLPQISRKVDIGTGITPSAKVIINSITPAQMDELLNNSSFKGNDGRAFNGKLGEISDDLIEKDTVGKKLTLNVLDILSVMENKEEATLTLKKDISDTGIVLTFVMEKKERASSGISLELLQNTDPFFIFITKEMFVETGAFDLSSVSNHLNGRNRGSLSGDYILLYDFRKGDYDAYKRVIRKNTGGGKTDPSNRYLEFYKQKRAVFFSPQVGSQFKVEILNFTNLNPINVEIEQTDNFLADGARFGALISTFNTNRDNEGKTAGTPSEQAGGAIIPVDQDSILIQLRNDLNYYNSHFQYSSFTAAKHEENLKYIRPIIVTKFGFETVDLVAEFQKLASDDKTTDPNAKTVIAQIILSLNQILNYKVIAFSTFKLKDRDNLIIKFKDDQNRVLKEEEIRISKGFKMDYSSGVFLTGLKDDNYVFKDTTVQYRTFESSSDTVGTLTDTGGNFILQEKTSKAKLNFGVMMHGYPRISSNYNLGLTVGISTNTNLDLNLLAGGSVMLGSERRIVFSGGWIWGKAQRISNTVQPGFRREGNAVNELENKPVFYSAENNLVPLAPSDWYRSWFFGVSFNLTRQ